MAWYSDEQYAMIQDSREKKSVAASAFKQRTHCGKGGSVKFPSDYLSRKELKAMNGECKSYRMNDPISWSEFVEWPNEHKIAYIKRIRDKFGASDQYIAEMFGVATNIFLMYLKELGLDNKIKCDENWEHNKFYAWRSGAKTELVEENSEAVEETDEQTTYEWNLMSWSDFKRMADEKKIEYIKWIRDTFNANDTRIAGAMGVGRAAYTKLIGRLGIGLGKGAGKGKCNEEEFTKWCEMKVEGPVSVPVQEIVDEEKAVETVSTDDLFKEHVKNIEDAEKALVKLVEAVEPTNDISVMEDKPACNNTCELVEDCEKKRIRDAGPIAFMGNPMPVVPKSGSMTFDGNYADDALQVLKVLLGNTRVKLSVSWECAFEDGIGVREA